MKPGPRQAFLDRYGTATAQTVNQSSVIVYGLGHASFDLDFIVLC
jgi:hypothetical protein